MSNCILWEGTVTTEGYGRLTVDRKKTFAHRHVYMQANGPIPAGMVIDHECHNLAASRGECSGGSTCIHRRCVNLEHLKAKTTQENLLAGLNDMLAGSPSSRTGRET